MVSASFVVFPGFVDHHNLTSGERSGRMVGQFLNEFSRGSELAGDGRPGVQRSTVISISYIS